MTFLIHIDQWWFVTRFFWTTNLKIAVGKRSWYLLNIIVSDDVKLLWKLYIANGWLFHSLLVSYCFSDRYPKRSSAFRKLCLALSYSVMFFVTSSTKISASLEWWICFMSSPKRLLRIFYVFLQYQCEPLDVNMNVNH